MMTKPGFNLFVLCSIVLTLLVGLVQPGPVIAQAVAYALQFRASLNQYVTFGEAAGMGSGGLGAQVFTIEAWVKPTGTGITTWTGGIFAVPIVTKGRATGADGSNTDMNYFFGLDTTNRLVADFEQCGTDQSLAGCPTVTGSGDNFPVVGTNPLQLNKWYHVAVSYDGRYWKLYLNGAPEPISTPIGGDLGQTRLPRWDSIQHAGIGTAMTSTGVPNGFFTGLIDEVRIWNVTRTPQQIADNMASELTSGTGLIGRWGLNENTGTVAINSITTGPDGTLMNSPTWARGFDVIPPAAPQGLLVTSQPLKLVLSWTANTDPDLAGYYVYRGTASPVDKGMPINGALLTSPALVDSDVTFPTRYYYSVTAVDQDGLESALSAEASAVSLPPDALDLGNTNAYVALGDNVDVPQFTLETWLRRDGAGTPIATGTGGVTIAPVIANGTPGGESSVSNINYIFGVRGASHVLCADFEESSDGTTLGLNHPVCGTTSLVNGTWYHAAATYDGFTWRLYLNGQLDGELYVGLPANTNNTSPLTFGYSQNTSGTPPFGNFDGALDEVRIWDRARTQTEIQSTMNSKIDTPRVNLAGRWSMDDASGSTVADTSGNNLTGTLFGTGYSWISGAPFNLTVPIYLPIVLR